MYCEKAGVLLLDGRREKEGGEGGEGGEKGERGERGERRDGESNSFPPVRLLFGLHAKPSLAPLHIHCISDDLCGRA